MKEYFQLQFKMSSRELSEFGLNPRIAFIVLPIVFGTLSTYLFINTEFAEYIYIIVALSLISKLSEPKRNTFLKIIFSKVKYQKLRMLENLISSLPFVGFMLYFENYLSAISLLAISQFLALFNFNARLNISVPTPFSKYPFEFLVGFRTLYFIFPIAYILTFISVSVGNFNLGIFSLILIALLSLSFYTKPENEYFVWIYKLSSKEFLWRKVKIAFIYFSVLSLPILLALSIFFFAEIIVFVGFLMLSYIYLLTIIMAKYSAYPNEINIPQGVIIGISLLFPPVLILVIPFFYLQSIKRLNIFLK